MRIPLEIAFEGGLEPSETLRARIEREAEKLERFHDRITSCHVAVIGRSHRHRQGGLYAVRLQTTAPGEADLVVDRNPSADHAHEDAFVTVRDAFAAARRRLQDRRRRLQGQVKTHEPAVVGHVTRLFPDDGYGFLESADGREIYFHRNAVLDDGFLRLGVGDEVHFAESEEGEKGAQASTVHPGRKSRRPGL